MVAMATFLLSFKPMSKKMAPLFVLIFLASCTLVPTRPAITESVDQLPCLSISMLQYVTKQKLVNFPFIQLPSIIYPEGDFQKQYEHALHQACRKPCSMKTR